MADAPATSYRIAGNDFRIGRIFERTIAIYRRNFVPFSLVTAVASTPSLLLSLYVSQNSASTRKEDLIVLFAPLATFVLLLLAQATLAYGAFQDLRGNPVRLSESVSAGLRRIFPILVLATFGVFTLTFFTLGVAMFSYMMALQFGYLFIASGLPLIPGIGIFVLIVASVVIALMIVVRWSVAVPVCMVERLPPWSSLRRSSQLTKGRRWKLFGTILLLLIASFIVDRLTWGTSNALGGSVVRQIVAFVWDVVWTAFFAIILLVTYYELRSDKEGISVDQITAVFD